MSHMLEGNERPQRNHKVKLPRLSFSKQSHLDYLI